MSDCAIIIPVYKADMTANELLSLRRVIHVLISHPLILCAPTGLDISAYIAEYQGFRVEYFDKEYFESIAGYNRLMLSPIFYGRFQANEYILIYKLDSDVFRDELDLWCNKGYDYIGAPWVVSPPKNPEAKKPRFDMAKMMLGKVGNGGFSLRKVKTHLRASKKLGFLIRFFPKNEDFFWCCIAPRFIKYKRPTLTEALGFSFELAPSMAFEQNKNKIPFGCHAWEKYEPEFWENYIPAKDER